MPKRYPPGRPRRGEMRPNRIRVRWIVNRAITRELKKRDCNPVAVLASIAGDATADPALRFRAADRLLGLHYVPRVFERDAEAEEPPELDVARIIEAAWAKEVVGPGTR